MLWNIILAYLCAPLGLGGKYAFSYHLPNRSFPRDWSWTAKNEPTHAGPHGDTGHHWHADGYPDQEVLDRTPRIVKREPPVEEEQAVPEEQVAEEQQQGEEEQ